MLDRLVAHPTYNLVALGVGLALSAAPFLAGFGGTGLPAYHAHGMGGLVAVLAARSLLQPHPWDHWAYLALGIWSFEAPWILGFVGWAETAAHMAAGLALAAISLGPLLAQRPPRGQGPVGAG